MGTEIVAVPFGDDEDGRILSSPFDAIMKTRPDGSKYWSGRELMGPMEYARWENMLKVIRKAKSACRNSGYIIENNFLDVKIFSQESKKPHLDVELTRIGCYLVAMNGDPDKPGVAAAQRYFTVMTRVAEVKLAERRQNRPWNERFSGSVWEEHQRFLNFSYPGCFTIASGILGYIFHLEDVIWDHYLETQSNDLPDGSIGTCWANYRRKEMGLKASDRTVPLFLPHKGYYVPVKVYDPSEHGAYQAWFYNIYMPEKLPAYLTNKPSLTFNREFRLPAASVAEQTCLRMTSKPANLEPKLRKQLRACGGIYRMGDGLPAPDYKQKSLF